MVDYSNKKSEKQLANEKSKRIMEGIAIWASFYRSNPQRFAKDYLNIHLKLFQKILLYAMMLNNYFMYIAARGQGKTYLTALFCVIRCILFPKTKICVASATRPQANEVLSKITDDFMGKVISLKLNPSLQDAIKFMNNPVNSMYEKLAAPLAVPLNTALGKYTQPTNAIPVFGPLIQRGTQMLKQGNPAPSVLSVYNTPRKTGQKTANGKWSNPNLAGANDYRDKQYRVPRYRNNNVLDPYYTFGKQRYSTLMYPIIDIAHDVKMKYSINVYNKIKNQVKVDVQRDIRNRMRIDANRFRK